MTNTKVANKQTNKKKQTDELKHEIEWSSFVANIFLLNAYENIEDSTQNLNKKKDKTKSLSL